MQLYVPAAAGLEAVVKRQLKKLGYEDTKAINGRISLSGEWEDVARLNVFLRSGERVLMLLSSFKAETFDELFDGVYAIPWEEYLSPHAKILMNGKSVLSKLAAIKASGAVTKKAIVKRLIEKKNLSGKLLDESGERYIVGISIYKDEVFVTLDTSGEGLHKRGYRSLAYSAPLKETTAAAMIDLSYYFPDKPFADIFCGSGTIPIEAAMKALNIAPGLKRDFDFSKWRCAPKGILERAKEEARDSITEKKLNIFAADINPKAVSIAEYHAKKAGVDGHITFKVQDMKEFVSDERYGVLISNPPYGERLGEEEEVKKLYKDLGGVYKRLPDWNMYILTGFKNFERFFGKRADKNRKLYNANIECYYYSYPSKKPTEEEKYGDKQN